MPGVNVHTRYAAEKKTGKALCSWSLYPKRGREKVIRKITTNA